MKKLFTDHKNLPSCFIPKIVERNSNYIFTNSLKDCDYVLMPHWQVLYEYSDKQYENHNLHPSVRVQVVESANNLINEAKKHNKKLIVFHLSDDDNDIPVDNAIIIRTSLLKSEQKENVFALPSWHGDLLIDNNRELEVRSKSKKPNVGFRGSARPLNPTLFDLYRYNMIAVNKLLKPIKLSFLEKHQWNVGQVLRKKAMINLMKNKHIKSDFQVLIRGWINQKDPKKRSYNKSKFLENIFDNDYTLCVRGAGNYSFRFYETISAGRIPLFINTDCALPYDFIVDWKKYCVWVEENDVNKVDQILLDFHHGLSDDDFKELQVKIRALWDQWISPQAFFQNFDYHFDSNPVEKHNLK